MQVKGIAECSKGILSTYIKLLFVILRSSFCLFFEWPLKTVLLYNKTILCNRLDYFLLAWMKRNNCQKEAHRFFFAYLGLSSSLLNTIQLNAK